MFGPASAHPAFRPADGLLPRPAYSPWSAPYTNQSQQQFQSINKQQFAHQNSVNRPAANSSPSTRPKCSNPARSRKPYPGKCQICSTHGHSAKFCTLFQVQPLNSAFMRAPRPQAHLVAPNNELNQPTVASPSWLLDSGATNHVTQDLHNLSLHTPYLGNDDIMVGDGTGPLDETSPAPLSG